MNVLISSAGRRGQLIECFRDAGRALVKIEGAFVGHQKLFCIDEYGRSSRGLRLSLHVTPHVRAVAAMLSASRRLSPLRRRFALRRSFAGDLLRAATRRAVDARMP